MIKKTKRIASVKGMSHELPFVDVKDPDYVYIPVTNGRCPKGDVSVKAGDHVYLYQQIGVRHGPFFEQPMHSTVSGKVVGIEKHYHRSGKLVDCVKIENDHKDEADPSRKERSDEEIAKLTHDEITEIVKDNSLVGLGGSSFPTYIKVGTKEKINTILINGVECEPYLYTDQLMMKEKADDIVRGVMILEQAFGVKDARICIKDIHPDCIEAVQKAIDAHPDSGIRIAKMKNFYPQGWEVTMIESATGIRLAPGELPMKEGIFDCNVATAASVYYAVKYNHPIVERYMTIQGTGVNAPCAFKVRVGTSLLDLLPYAKGYSTNEKMVLISGGPMMGNYLPSDDVICTKCMTSIIALRPLDAREEPCIRCGSCVLSCPANLQPVLIMEAVKAMNKDAIKKLNPLACVECGLCSYSCTSNIRVTDYIRRAKIIAKL
jgi:electron transport complex protein RnfC